MMITGYTVINGEELYLNFADGKSYMLYNAAEIDLMVFCGYEAEFKGDKFYVDGEVVGEVYNESISLYPARVKKLAKLKFIVRTVSWLNFARKH